MTTQNDTSRPLFRLDGNIPAWGVIVLGLTFAWYVIDWMNEQEKRATVLEQRVTAREQSAGQYRTIVDNLVKDQSRLVQVEVKLSHIGTVLERLERKLDNGPTGRP